MRFLSQRFAERIHALEEREEELHVTRPPFFHPKLRQLAITEEHKIVGEKLNVKADADRVEVARQKVERILIAKFSKLILVLDPESAVEAR